MTKLIPAVVAVALMLVFLVINQFIIETQSPKTAKNTSSINISRQIDSPSGTMLQDNGKRDAHSYFTPPRILSNRYRNGQINSAGSSPNTQNPVVLESHPVTSTNNSEDLLSAGYLSDIQAGYKPAFGASLKD